MKKCRRCRYYRKIYSFEECHHELSKYGGGWGVSYLLCYVMTSHIGDCGSRHKLFEKQNKSL